MAQEIAQGVMSLLSNHEDLACISSIHVRAGHTSACPQPSAMERRVEIGRSQEVPTSQCSRMVAEEDVL